MPEKEKKISRQIRQFYMLFTLFCIAWIVAAWFIANNQVKIGFEKKLAEQGQQLQVQANSLAGNIISYLGQVKNIPSSLTQEESIIAALSSPVVVNTSSQEQDDKVRRQTWTDAANLRITNNYLAKIANYTDASVIYVLDASGKCVLSSNFEKNDSFVGGDFNSRDYYTQARSSGSGYQYALGRLSNLPGLYFSAAIMTGEKFLGVAVVKINLAKLETWVEQSNAFLTDEYDVVIASYNQRHLYHALPTNQIRKLATDKLLKRYKRDVIPSLLMKPYQGTTSSRLFMLEADTYPELIIDSMVSPQLTLHATRPVEQFILLGQERNNLFIILSLSGLVVLLVILWRIVTLHNRQIVKHQLAINEANLNLAQHISQVGSFDWNITTGELRWSDEHFRQWGMQPGSQVPSYELFIKHIHPRDLKLVENTLNNCLTSDGYYDCIHRVCWDDGTEHYIHGQGQVIFDKNHSPVQMTGTVKNITAQQQAEHALLKTRDAVEQANRMMHAVLDTIPMRIFWKDSNLTYLGCNQLFAEDAGMSSPSEVIGKTDYDMACSEFAEEHRRDDKQVIESGEPRLNYEQMLKNPDGTTIWLRTSKVPLLNRDGKAFGVLGTYEVITDEKEAEQALIEARDTAEKASKAKTEFLSRMSHELRTPMNAILGFGQILQMNNELDEDSRGNVEEILKGGEHLLSLINEVLDLAKIESGHLDLRPVATDINVIVRESSGLVRSMAERFGIKMIVNPAHDRNVYVDPMRLKQALVNLFSNAIKYNRANGEIRVGINDVEDGWVSITISDTGMGIPADQIDNLFKPFNRLERDKSSTIEGTGIGLAITHRLVGMMGGTISVVSEEGVGSTFTIELPTMPLQQ